MGLIFFFYWNCLFSVRCFLLANTFTKWASAKTSFSVRQSSTFVVGRLSIIPDHFWYEGGIWKTKQQQQQRTGWKARVKGVALRSRVPEGAAVLSVWRDQLRSAEEGGRVQTAVPGDTLGSHICAWLVGCPVWREPTSLCGKCWKELKWTLDTFSKEKRHKKHKKKQSRKRKKVQDDRLILLSSSEWDEQVGG